MATETDAMTGPRRRAWTVAAAGLVVLLSYSVRGADPDLWGHVLFGQLWLSEGVVQADPYSYTAGGHPWIGHEIGAEIVLNRAYAWGGPAGLCALKTVAGVLVALIVWCTFPRSLRSSWLGLLVWVGVGHVVSLYLFVRPQLFTYVGTALTGAILFQHGRRPTRAVWLLPLICAVWVNFHGGWVMLLGLSGLHLVGAGLHAGVGLLRGRRTGPHRPGRWALPWVLAASGLATLANPYGPKIWACLYRALSNPYTGEIIDEWGSIAWFCPTGRDMLCIMLIAALMISAVGGITWKRLARGDARVSIDTIGLLVCALTAFLATRTCRHIPLFAIVAAPWLLRWGGRAWRRMARRRPARAALFAPAVALLVLFPALCSLWGIVRDPRPRLRHPYPMPVGAVRYLQEHRLSGNIYNSFNWGQYLIAHLYPQFRVAMDGRYDTAYPEEEFVANFRFIREGDTDRAVRPPTDFVLVATGSAADTSMSKRDDWRVIHEDEVSTVWARAGNTSALPRYDIRENHPPLDPEFYP